MYSSPFIIKLNNIRAMTDIIERMIKMGTGITGDLMIEGVNVSKQIREGNQKSIKEKMVNRLKQDCEALLSFKIPKALENISDDKGVNTYRNLTRALADNIKLIEEYEWSLMYSEYETTENIYTGQMGKQVAVWEQNCDGDIRNHKVWNVESPTISGVLDESVINSISKSIKESFYKNDNIR